MPQPETLTDALIFLGLGLAALVFGADFFVRSSSSLARKFGLSPLFIGLTIVALGTSLPEMAVSVNASWKGTGGLSVGNVLGSNVCNILLILGAMSLFRVSQVRNRIIRVEIPQLVAVSLIPFFVGADFTLSRIDGVIMLCLLAGFLGWAYRSENKEVVENLFEESPKEKMALGKTVVFFIVGLVLIFAGSQATVEGAVKMAQFLGVSELVIGFTLVAFGTSVPELVVALVAAFKGEDEIALGNVVGSNIMNILAVMGSSALVRPIPLEESFFGDAGMGFLSAVILWPLVRARKKLGRPEGLVLLSIYVGYTVYLFIM